MVSANHAHIIVHAVHCADVAMAGNKPARQCKTAGDRVLNRPCNFWLAVDLDAGITPVEKLARLYVGVMICGAVDRQSKRLNHVGADEKGRTERVGTRQAASVTGVLK